ncbi:MAG: hypothetical protein RIT81_16220 [Deltaproteobacteria bacterium]
MALTNLLLLLATQNPTLPANLCVPGAQTECACLGGKRGIQVCEDDGRRFSKCECPKEPPAPVAAAPAQGPRELPYEEGVSVPAGYHVATRSRSTLIEAGLGTSAALYLTGGIIASLIDAGGTRETTHRWLYLPVVGPFVAALSPEQGEPDSFTFILVIDGLLQAAGLVSAIYGLSSDETYLSRSDITVAPFSSDEAGSGLAVMGRF